MVWGGLRWFVVVCGNSTDPNITPGAVRSFTGMDLITGMDYRNGHLYLSLSTFHLVFEDKLA